MARKKYTVEQIISHLREAEVRLGQGATVGAVCRSFERPFTDVSPTLGGARP